MLVIHAIWVDESDLELLAMSKCTVAHNPISNQKIGSGIMPFRRLRTHDIPICLGTDEASVDDSANMWGAAKAAGLIHKLSDPEYRNWPKAPELLWCLTRGGARGMGLADTVGALAPGYEADIILVDLNTISFTPLNDLRRQLVFCEHGSSVVLTMVAGQVVAERGRVLTVDEEAIKAEVRELMQDQRGEIERTAAAAAELHPFYRTMYLRAASRDVGMSRWSAPMIP
jgi:5-methylthioadenosine/S-adenosylhomocysteine deaminase